MSADRGSIVGFYHVSGNSMEEVVSTFKPDPRFEDTEWRMDIWPILKIEGIN